MNVQLSLEETYGTNLPRTPFRGNVPYKSTQQREIRDESSSLHQQRVLSGLISRERYDPTHLPVLT